MSRHLSRHGPKIPDVFSIGKAKRRSPLQQGGSTSKPFPAPCRSKGVLPEPTYDLTKKSHEKCPLGLKRFQSPKAPCTASRNHLPYPQRMLRLSAKKSPAKPAINDPCSIRRIKSGSLLTCLYVCLCVCVA